MRAHVHLAPPPSIASGEASLAVEDALLPVPVDPRQLGMSPYSGFVTYRFSDEAVVHRGIFSAIASRLAGRQPTIGIEGVDVHVSFALEDDSVETRHRVERVARQLQALMPNSVLGDVAIGYAPYDGPGSRPLRLVDAEADIPE